MIKIINKKTGGLLGRLYHAFSPNNSKNLPFRIVDKHPPDIDWIDYPDNVRTSVIESTEIEDFHSALTSDESQFAIDLNPESPVDRIHFKVYSPRSVDKAVINIESSGKNGNTEKYRIKHNNPVNDFLSKTPIPCTIDLDDPSRSIELNIKFKQSSDKQDDNDDLYAVTVPELSYTEDDHTPIFILSIDSLRHEGIQPFREVFESLNADYSVPAEPWTQAHWTRPSHASIFTGTHPGTHGYGMRVLYENGTNQISSELETLPSLLMDRGYKTRYLMNFHTISPAHGLGRGFHKSSIKDRNWNSMQNGTAELTDHLIHSVRNLDGDDNIFMFGHFFDTHHPYLTESVARKKDVNLEELDRYKNAASDSHFQYAEELNSLEKRGSLDIDYIRSLYKESTQYVADELERFFVELDKLGLFDQSLIILTGDHGEQFFDYGFGLHKTLHDDNLRPGMLVKPPNDSNIQVPDQIDTIDFMPLIADYLDIPVPEQCAGKSWIDSDIGKERVRITEAFKRSLYQISCEINGDKVILSYDNDKPKRPTEKVLEEDPQITEYYSIQERRSGKIETRGDPIPENIIKEINKFAVSRSNKTPNADIRGIDKETKEQLEKLGYS